MLVADRRGVPERVGLAGAAERDGRSPEPVPGGNVLEVPAPPGFPPLHVRWNVVPAGSRNTSSAPGPWLRMTLSNR